MGRYAKVKADVAFWPHQCGFLVPGPIYSKPRVMLLLVHAPEVLGSARSAVECDGLPPLSGARACSGVLQSSASGRSRYIKLRSWALLLTVVVAKLHSNLSSTISGFVPKRIGGPHVPTPQLVNTIISPIRCSPWT
jgi:hypothetical protein